MSDQFMTVNKIRGETALELSVTYLSIPGEQRDKNDPAGKGSEFMIALQKTPL